jgi:PhnB protein
MKLNPYLSFNGQCEAAFKFYEKCLNGQIMMMMRYGESPTAEQTPADFRDKVMHVTMSFDDQILQGADVPPQRYEKPQGVFLSLNVESVPEAERIFAALSEKGTVQMPIQQTFWAKRFGMLADQFATPWMINCVNPG